MHLGVGSSGWQVGQSGSGAAKRGHLKVSPILDWL